MLEKKPQFLVFSVPGLIAQTGEVGGGRRQFQGGEGLLVSTREWSIGWEGEMGNQLQSQVN